MVPGGECHRKEASGTRAREGIQDNVKPDSRENRPALSFLTTSAAASPSTSFPSIGGWEGVTLNSAEAPSKIIQSSGWKEGENPCLPPRRLQNQTFVPLGNVPLSGVSFCDVGAFGALPTPTTPRAPTDSKVGVYRDGEQRAWTTSAGPLPLEQGAPAGLSNELHISPL